MLVELALVAALSVERLAASDLEQYYWDCDTLYMKGEMGGQDTMSCLAITEEFQKRVFKNDRAQFMQYWRRENLTEWYKRGYTPRMEDLPRLR